MSIQKIPDPVMYFGSGLARADVLLLRKRGDDGPPVPFDSPILVPSGVYSNSGTTNILNLGQFDRLALDIQCDLSAGTSKVTCLTRCYPSAAANAYTLSAPSISGSTVVEVDDVFEIRATSKRRIYLKDIPGPLVDFRFKADAGAKTKIRVNVIPWCKAGVK